MFLDVANYRAANGKVYSRALLRTSYRENGKVKHRTVGNLSSCSPEEIEAVRLALRHTDQLNDILKQIDQQQPISPSPTPPAPPEPPQAHFTQGPSVGAVLLLSSLAQQLGISDALGNDRAGKLALWQVIARALDQGSRLSAVHLARDLGAATVLGLPAFDEDDLYENLAWLQTHQSRIESDIFQDRHADGARSSLSSTTSRHLP